ncbi:YrbL family protein [Modicisalibacter luteus]|uniref:YrbL family protein n=1 Tax=Modicisalibacter luteus TaxID=453962 RepID=A0ABV7M3W7_9GAMM|nr:YrbL family protein [Halomonas lutea]GHA87925.1 hypothetical protein GCM10007159_06660 [Halomonas lutea]
MKYQIPHYPESPRFELDDASLIGQGNKRNCHAHPGDPAHCIKVARYQERWEECQEQSIVEWHYLRFLKRRRIPLHHVADCYGWVTTTSGVGLDLELVRNDDGTPALTLRNAMQNGAVSMDSIHTMLSELKAWALRHAVVIADLNTDNLMVRWTEGIPHFVIIDGLGSRHPGWKFYLYQRCKWLARFKTRRQWERQEKALFETLARITA